MSDTIKITLALQNLRSNLARFLSVSVSKTTTWIQVNALLISYFNNAAFVETKAIYQLNNTDKKEEVNFVKKGKGKGQKSKGPHKGKGSKRTSSSFQPQNGQSKAKERPSQKAKVNGPLGHGITIKTRIRIRQGQRRRLMRRSAGPLCTRRGLS